MILEDERLSIPVRSQWLIDVFSRFVRTGDQISIQLAVGVSLTYDEGMKDCEDPRFGKKLSHEEIEYALP